MSFSLMRFRASHWAIAACLYFFLAGQVFIPLLGIEADEALFGMAFLPPRYAASIRIGHSTLPLMIMTYLGALKASIYRPILRWFRPGVWTLREPMLIAGAASIWLFYLLLRRIAGERAAIIGAVLLATDSLYLLTTCFDWGPVALQHLLTIAGAYLLLRFAQEKTEGALAGSAFLLGLAVWDKALAAWMLSGMGIAALLVFRREIWSLLTLRRIAIAAGAFLLGTLPLLAYNAKYEWATFHGNFHRDFSQFRGKSDVLLATFDGQGLLGYLAREDSGAIHPHQPAGALQTMSAQVVTLTGDPRHNLTLYAFLIALLLVPFGATSAPKTVLFSLIAMIVSWFQMAITANAGGSVHHTILLWPLPYVVISVSFAAASRRLGTAGLPAAAVVTSVLLLSSALLMNAYYHKMFRNGGSESWNDAIFPLNSYVRDLPATYVYCMDWGLLDGLRFLSRGKLKLAGVDDRFTKAELTPDERHVVEQLLADGENLYIAHTPGAQVFPDNPKFLARAAEFGYRPNRLAIIEDSFGRPTFEVYRMVK